MTTTIAIIHQRKHLALANWAIRSTKTLDGDRLDNIKRTRETDTALQFITTLPSTRNEDSILA